MKQAFPIDHAVPISKTIRAGDFVFTSAFGPWLFDPRNITYDEADNIVDDGTGNLSMPFEEQVHRTFGYIKEALAVAGCTLEDVVNCECWLSEARDFVAFNAIFTADGAVVADQRVHAGDVDLFAAGFDGGGAF